MGMVFSSNPFLDALNNSPFGISGTDWLRNLSPPKKRKAFFSFHFDDIMRVNAVRKAWKVHNPDTLLAPSFTDSSLWEKSQVEGAETLKRLIRGGVAYTSAVCVLVGTETWARRWVRYEIARAVVDNRGLLTVHLNGILSYNGIGASQQARATYRVFSLVR